MHRAIMVCAALAAFALGQMAWAKSGSAKPPATRPADEPDPVRLKWENAVLFYGDEDTGQWSLRIRDKDVDQQHEFRFRELWQFDWPSKKWVKISTTPSTTTMLPAADRPKDSGPPDQILAELPIADDQMGLFYAKWNVDEVKGSTYFRVGPGLKEKSPLQKKKPPEGKVLGIVPIDINHIEAAFIPDPHIVCEREQEHEAK